MKKTLIVLSGVAAVAAGLAFADEPLAFEVRPDRADSLYACGEKTTFAVTATWTNGVKATKGTVVVRLDDTGTNACPERTVDLAKGNPFTVEGSLAKPGFLRLTLRAPGAEARCWSTGYEPTKIAKGSPSPADFDAFWADARAKLAREVPLDAQTERVAAWSKPAYDFYRISFATFGRRVYGYLSVPTDKSKGPFPVRLQVSAAGFGGWTNHMDGSPDEIRAFFAAMPFPPDFDFDKKGLAKDYRALNASCQEKYGCDYPCAGISESREAYFFYPLLLGVDRAVDWIAARPDVDRTRFRYYGVSQGGGFGFYLCGLNRNFTCGAVFVPAMTDVLGCLAGRISGWPRLVEGQRPENRAAAERNAPYFDAANFAARITCPFWTAVGFSDTTCPPPAVYAAFNAIPGKDKTIVHGLDMAHRIGGRFAREVEDFYAAAPQTALRKALPGIFAKAADHYRQLDAAATPLARDAKGGFRTPHGFRRDRRELDMRSVLWWTAGHFPGSLWYLYEATGDAFFRDRAMAWTERVAPNAKVTDNHDVGFIMYCSYGNARRLLKTDRFDAILRETADSLCTRYNPQLGLIRSWGKSDEKKDFRVIPDNLMNLELLEACAHMKGGPQRLDAIARSHADVTMRHHFRPDGGCFHVLDYDQETKRVKNVARGQGASCETAWSRGQSWAVYGYVMMYRMTALRRYLDFARKLADFALNHPNMPADGIPYWDYGAPGEERDSSAGAILASALLELAQYVDAADRARYRGFAVRQLTSLASSAYFSEGDEIGHFLLKHGTGHKPGHSEIDTPLDYGDYYFLEALLRFRELTNREAAREEVRAKLSVRPMQLPAGELAARAPMAGAKLRKLAEAALREPIPETSDELYGEFWTTGNRSHYQDRFFPRLRNLCALALAEAKDGKGRYLPRLAEYLTAVCGMKSWVLPAHDWSDDGRGNLRGTSPSVDLFSSEVAAKLACVLRLVGDRLDPSLVARVKSEAERRIFAPLRRELAGGGAFGQPPRQHWWMMAENNWNAVCWDNAVCAALGLLEAPEDRVLFVSAALKGIGPYLSGFTPDGYCSEGMGYWNYGFGHHLLMGRLLRAVTDGRLDVFTEPIQRNVAAYARAYTLCEGISPAFADGNGSVHGQWLDYVDAIWPDLPKDLPAVSEFPDGQVWLLRDPEGLSVAFKGGHNDELHNHNDVGSYAVVKDGKVIGGEPGGEEYTRFTFSKKRYESKVLNSYGHPVPVVGGKLQSTGRSFAAKVVSRNLSSPQAKVVLDLTGAYSVPTLKALTRTFVFDREKKTFAVRDHVEFTEPTAFETAYVTFTRERNAKVRGPYGWNVRPEVSVTGGSHTLVEEDVPNPNRLSPHRVGIRLDQPVRTADVTVKYGIIAP